MGGSLGKVNRKKLKNKIYTKKIKNEDTVRYIGDFSPPVEFKSDQFNSSIKLSRHLLLVKLKNDISSKFDQMFGSDIQLKGGLHQISLYLDMALNDLMHNVRERKFHEINVISFLNLYKMKKDINPQEQNYGIIRGLI